MRAIVVFLASLMPLNVSSVQAPPTEMRDQPTIAMSAPQATDFSAAKRHTKDVRPTPESDFEAVRGMTHGAERAQIACTRVGCQPVPRGCLREPERSFSDEPTGFDAIVCPAR
jgi:hypothetical protein